jgi:cytochrome c5
MPERYTLRQLPFPAKLVISAFLISVGVGYFSALVQLHMQHGDRDGEALPTPENVIERFSGLKKPDGKRAPSKIELLVSGSPTGGFDKNNMTPAFFAKSTGYEKDVKARGKAVVDAERDGERQALLAWLQMPEAEQKTAYDAKTIPIPEALVGKPITEDFVDTAKKTVDINAIFEARCLKCHSAGGDNKPEMEKYEDLQPLITTPNQTLIDGKWVRSSKQTTLEGLTQSTHAHLLSFSMLFSLTGLCFAFTSYPGIVRGFLGPLVLVAQLADISCWWLARVDGYGPYFAQAIMATGGVVGLGLSAQIVLSLFNMYGWFGKIVLHGVGLLALSIFAVLVITVIEPGLKAEKAKLNAPKTEANEAPKPEAKPAPKPAEDDKRIPPMKD